MYVWNDFYILFFFFCLNESFINFEFKFEFSQKSESTLVKVKEIYV